MTRVTDMRDDPQAEGSGWLSLAGGGAYCAGPTIQLVNHIDSVLRSLNVAPRTSETTSQIEGCIN